MAVIAGRKVKLFTLNANRELAEKISNTSGIPLSKVEVERFSDGEISINISESVRGNDCFVVQPTSSPVNSNLMELLIMVDALKRASARTINVLIPYYGYSRQDRKAKSREPITAKLVANILQAAGISRVMSIDLHAAQIQGFFDIPIDNFSATSLLASYFIRKKELDDVVVVSPDHGGVTRARNFARRFDAPLAIVDKRRPEANRAEVMNIIGDVKGKTAIMIDDIIDTAGTAVAAAEALIKAGAKKVYLAATHPVLSGEAITRLKNSPIDEIVVTDSIYLPEDKRIDKIVQISIGPLLGKSIIQIILDEPISHIFDVIDNITEIWN